MITPGDRQTVLSLAMRYVYGRKARGEIAAATARGNRCVLTSFADTTKNPLVSRLTRRHVERFLESNRAPATKALELTILRGFFRWLVIEGHIRRDPTLGMKGPKKPRGVPRGLNREQVDRIFNVCPDDRAKLIISLMVQEGLRCMEVAGLQRADVDLTERTLFVVGKGGHERLLPLTDGTATLVGRYLDQYPTNAGPLIRGYMGDLSDSRKAISPNHISILVTGWFRDAAVKGTRRDGRSAHALRHTMASDLARAGADVVVIQRALGHANLSTTSRYVGQADLRRMREAMAGRDYRAAQVEVGDGQ